MNEAQNLDANEVDNSMCNEFDFSIYKKIVHYTIPTTSITYSLCFVLM